MCYDALGLGLKYQTIYTTERKMFGLCTRQRDVDGTWIERKPVFIDTGPDIVELNKCKIISIKLNVSNSETELWEQ
jgi:hypothetical protein